MLLRAQVIHFLKGKCARSITFVNIEESCLTKRTYSNLDIKVYNTEIRDIK